MKKSITRLSIALLMIISICATIHLNTQSSNLTSIPSEKINLSGKTPAETTLPEVQIVKTILTKFIEL